MMVCSVMNIMDVLTTVIGREHNLLFSYITETTNQPLLRTVRIYEGAYDMEADNIQHKQSLYNMVDKKW